MAMTDFFPHTFTMPEHLLRNVAIWFMLCWLFHCLTAVIVKPNWPRFAVKDKYIRWSAYNRTVAFMHSTVMFSMTVHYYLHINPGFNVQNMMTFNPFVAMTNDFMIGYLVYDTVHELNFPEKPDRETMFHHILGLITHIFARCMGSNIACVYYMMVYVAELSTPCLHLCWGMYAMGFKETLAFTVVCITVLLTYLLCRIMWGPYMLYHCYIHREVWSSVADQWLYIPNMVILSIFNVLNFVWYKALLVKFLQTKASKGGEEISAGINPTFNAKPKRK